MIQKGALVGQKNYPLGAQCVTSPARVVGVILDAKANGGGV